MLQLFLYCFRLLERQWSITASLNTNDWHAFQETASVDVQLKQAVAGYPWSARTDPVFSVFI